ncbi:DUF418 domain-containing protein [Geomicrobium sp. JCM 19055]|uniref:DUF418 domain-containing protein n=1 Tax=Geomicrobium sp. JCM 19055 TaxID=1460649 RepID=UPI0005A7B5EB|nr:DUF418 domain-containing protein [Geomicrobium sp. JCM 19055]
MVLVRIIFKSYTRKKRELVSQIIHKTDALLVFIGLLQFSATNHQLFYFSSLLWLLQASRWQKILRPFQVVGRTALTNYLLQSIIGMGFFIGFGLFGSLNLSLGLLVVIVVFPIQVLFSFYWLKAFHYGPMEWLWRTATYGKRQPLKKTMRLPIAR